MTKKNNKGFSLIEIVIAIAVLTLLLSPIIVQLVQSIRVNSQAKEKQYVVENAEYVLEYFQKTDIDDIGADGAVTVAGTPVSTTVSCEVHNAAGSTLSSSVSYTVTDYVLDSKNLGRDQNEYNRTVSIDDLSNRLLANDFNVKYDFTDDETSALQSNGYTFTNEGSCVKYDSNNHIIDIICEQNAEASGYVDPNEVNLGYVQDLDSTKVAIIQGVASNSDEQAASEFYALKMSHLKQISYSSWEQAMNHTEGESIFSAADFRESTNKFTKISITSGEADGKTYYDVSCDIYYSDVYTISITPDPGFVEVDTESTKMVRNGNSVDVTDILNYNVYSQRFYTNEAPDIYLIYEPFVEESTDSTAQYASRDYITVYNDEASKDAKLYLIKPDNSQLTVKQDANSYDMSAYSGNVFWTNVSGGVWSPVTIYINQINFTDPSKSTEPLMIYTNLNIEGDGSNMNMAQSFEFSQILSGLTYIPNLKNPDGTELTGYPEYSVDTSDTTRSDYVKPISEDTRYDGRLYSVTVRLFRTDDDGDVISGSETTFTGAKGAN